MSNTSASVEATSVSFMTDSAEITKEGWLNILSKKKWERRYFILKRGSSMLSYYKSPKDRTKGKIIQLFLSSCTQSNIKGQKYTFQLISRAETLMLKGESIEEMNGWIMLIQETCAGLLSAGLDNNPPSDLPFDMNNDNDHHHHHHDNNDHEDDSLSSDPSSDHHSPSNVANLINAFNNNVLPSTPSPSLSTTPSHSLSHSLSNPHQPTEEHKRPKLNYSIASSPSSSVKKVLAHHQDHLHQYHHLTQSSPSSVKTSPKRPITIQELLKRFSSCCDCNADLSHPSLSYVSLLIGSFVCRDCAVIHQQLLNQASDIRSISPDPSNDFPPFDQSADPMAMTFLGFMGNKKVNDYWEASIPERIVKPNATSSIDAKKHWISEKYIKKTFKGCKQGYLFIKAADRKKSKRFWVVLGDSSLFLYKRKEDTKEREVIGLQSCGVKVGDDPTEPECFSIITPGKRYKIQAVTFPAALEWANAVRVAASSLVHHLTSSSSSSSRSLPSKPFSDNYDKKLYRRESRLIVNPHVEQGGGESRGGQGKSSDWLNLKSHLISYEEQLKSNEDDVIELECKLSKTKDEMKRIEEERYEKLKELYGKSADWSTDHQLIRHNRNQSVLAANPQGFVLSLFSSPQDKEYIREFMLSYRSFMSTARLLAEFAECFNNPSTDPATKQSINGIIEVWIKDHYYDIEGDYDGVRNMMGYIEGVVEGGGYAEEAARMRIILRNQMAITLKREKIIIEDAPPSIDPPPPNPLNQSEEISLFDLDDLEIARQMCLIDHKLFCSIKPRELLNRGWLQEERSTEAPNVRAMIDQFERRVNWALTWILRYDDRKKRSLMLSKFIQIAKHCANLRNFNATMQIMSAIEDNIILKFDGTWEGINQKSVPLLLELRKLLSKANNFANLRVELYSKRGRCIPFLQPFLEEILSLETELPDIVNHLINFEKRRKISRVILELQRYQSLSSLPSDLLLSPSDKDANDDNRRDEEEEEERGPYRLRLVPSIANHLIALEAMSKEELLNYAIITQLSEPKADDPITFAHLLGIVPFPSDYLPPGLAPSP